MSRPRWELRYDRRHWSKRLAGLASRGQSFVFLRRRNEQIEYVVIIYITYINKS